MLLDRCLRTLVIKLIRKDQWCIDIIENDFLIVRFLDFKEDVGKLLLVLCFFSFHQVLKTWSFFFAIFDDLLGIFEDTLPRETFIEGTILRSCLVEALIE